MLAPLQNTVCLWSDGGTGQGDWLTRLVRSLLISGDCSFVTTGSRCCRAGCPNESAGRVGRSQQRDWRRSTTQDPSSSCMILRQAEIPRCTFPVALCRTTYAADLADSSRLHVRYCSERCRRARQPSDSPPAQSAHARPIARRPRGRPFDRHDSGGGGPRDSPRGSHAALAATSPLGATRTRTHLAKD